MMVAFVEGCDAVTRVQQPQSDQLAQESARTVLLTSRRMVSSCGFVVGAGKRLIDPIANPFHFVHPHASGGQGWRANANARRIHRLSRVERDHVHVDGDATLVQHGFGPLSSQVPTAVTSTNIRWLSVPPLTNGNPADSQGLVPTPWRCRRPIGRTPCSPLSSLLRNRPLWPRRCASRGPPGCQEKRSD